MSWLKTRPKKRTEDRAKETTCSFLYDAGNYGGLRYWCENTTDPGLLGQGTRIPITDDTHVTQFCKGDYDRCPLNLLKR